jgi:AcrR family transcriptional regulator
VTGDTRERILGAAVVCVGRSGFAKTSIEAVAVEAGVGRATVYRYFPGGKEEVFAQTIAWEVFRFFQRLADEVDERGDLADRLEAGLRFAHRELAEHEVFQKVVETEPERLLPHLSQSGPLITAALSEYFEPLLAAAELTPGATVHDTADHLARMVLSYIIGQGSWDLDDPAQVRELVRGQLLAGVLADHDRRPLR